MNDIIRNSDTETWANFIISNYKQWLLLIMVFLIIYCVEYISYVNIMFYDMMSMPSIPGVTKSLLISTKKNKNKKMKR